MPPFTIPFPVGRISANVRLRRRIWSSTGMRLAQSIVAGGAAFALCLIMHDDCAPLAPLVAITTVQVFSASRRRSLWLYLAGAVSGTALGLLFNPASGVRVAAQDIVIGSSVGAIIAIVVVSVTLPREPVTLLVEALQPVLTRLADNLRVIAHAMQTGDTVRAASAVYSLNDIEPELARLDEVLQQMRHPSLVSRGEGTKLFQEYAQGAREIGYAVRAARAAAWHSWWGVLRRCERVPPLLPAILEEFADAVTDLRDHLAGDGQLDATRQKLIAIARSIDALRPQALGLSASAVAASVDGAILNLLIATGTPVYDTDLVLRQRPQPVASQLS